MPKHYVLTEEDKRRLDALWAALNRRRTERPPRTRPRTPAQKKQRYYKAPTGGLAGKGESKTPTATECIRIKRNAAGDFYLADDTDEILSWAYGTTADSGERMLIAEYHTGADDIAGNWHLAAHDPCDETEQEKIIPAGVSNNSGFTTGFSTGFDSSSYYSTGPGGGLNGGLGYE